MRPAETAGVNTIADGLVTHRLVPEALAVLQGRIDDVLMANGDDLRTGMRSPQACRVGERILGGSRACGNSRRS